MTHTQYSPEAFFDLSDFEHQALFRDVTWAWQALENLQAYLLSSQLGKICSSQQAYSYMVHPELISIGEGTIVEAGAYIRGPCIIGRNCHIRHSAYIRGNVLIGDDCVVGHTTELKGAVLLNHVRAAHFAFVGDSILGNNVNLGAGVKCANLRLDNQPVKVPFSGSLLSTGLRKFGALVGDDVQLGCNVVLNPGTCIGKRAACFPSLNISGSIEADRIVRPIKKQYEVVTE